MTAQSLRLLLVEDVENDALLLVRALRKEWLNLDYTRVDTPQALKAALANGPWDAIFSDYHLQGFTGLDSLRIVREMGLDLPFILVSGVLGEEAAVEALQAGANDYLMKGRYARLVPALERALRDVALQRERQQTEAELRQHREHLEELIQARTEELAAANAELTGSIEKLQATEKELQKVINEQKIILGNIGVGVMFVKNREIVWTNPAMTRIFGYAPDELLGQTAELLSIDQERYRKARDEAYAALASEELYNFQAQMKRKDGELRWINLVGQVLSPGHPEEGLIWMLEDITVRKQLADESSKARNLESLGILAGGIAHDFNNLFQVLLGNITLAKLHIPESSEAFGFLSSAEKAYQQGAKLTSRLIAFSSGGFSCRENIQPTELIKKAVLSQTTGATDLELDFDLADDLGTVEVDVGQLEQVLQHLTKNAIEAMPSGGRLRVAATTESIAAETPISLAPGKYLKISFKDQGCGISEEIMPRIFDPYFSTKPLGAKKGIGLGLSLCETIAKKHGGAITVESSPGAGATFQVYFPAKD